MIANIIHKNVQDKTVLVFCEYPEIDQREIQKRWDQAVLKTCPNNGSCSVGSAHMVSMLPWSDDIQKALNSDGPTTSGLLVGIKLDDRTWQRVESGQVLKFDLTFDDSGIKIVPQRESTSKISKIRKGKTMTSSELVSKCISGVNKSDLSGLTRQNFADALDSLTVKYSIDHQNISYEKAYTEILKSEQGRTLYAGYDSIQKDMPNLSDVHTPTTDDAESSSSESESSSSEESESTSETDDTTNPTDDQNAYQKIEREARKVVRASGYKLSLAKAIEQVLKDRPELYTKYEDARQRRQRAGG